MTEKIKKKGQFHSSILLSATDAWKFGGDVCGEAINNIRNGIRLVLRENQHSKVMPKKHMMHRVDSPSELVWC